MRVRLQCPEEESEEEEDSRRRRENKVTQDLRESEYLIETALWNKLLREGKQH